MDADVDVEDILQSPTSQIGRTLVLNSVSLLCKLALNVLNTTTAQVATEQAVQELLLEREEGTSLITVANHTRTFFKSGKGLPVKRGGGQDQQILDVMARRLASHGDWVCFYIGQQEFKANLHVFPEGRISYNGKIADLRWGIGKMVCDVMKHSGGKPPVVLPYYHTGMGDVFPYKAKFPRVGHSVHVLFGKPLDLQDLTCKCNKAGVDQPKVWREITERVRGALVELEEQSEPNADQIEFGRAPQRHESGHDRSTAI